MRNNVQQQLRQMGSKSLTTLTLSLAWAYYLISQLI